MKRKYRLTILIIALLFFCSFAHATIWYVHPDSTLNSIQMGLNSCSPNDTVLVAPGTYYENLIWPGTAGIDLISESGPESTIIDGGGNGRVIRIGSADPTTVIRDFTIQNGWLDLDGGGGINCGHGSSPTITGNIIANNRAYFGGGIMCYDYSSAVIIGNTITGNTGIEGGGITSYFYSSPIVCDNLISGNNAAYGGGVMIIAHASPTVTGNTITENTADWGGGVVFSDYATATITGNTVERNNAYYGGGIGCGWHSSPFIIDNTIAKNTAYTLGGGIGCWESSSPSITNNTVTENTSGGGIGCSNGSSPIIDSCTISNNTGGGVLCMSNSNPVIHYNDITNNNVYGVQNVDSSVIVDATYNWWGDSSGPGGLGPGTGDEVSDYVDYEPWLTEPGIGEQPIVKPVEKRKNLGPTIFSGPLILPKDKKCKVFDITGRTVAPDRIKPGIYFIEVDGELVNKVIKVR